MDFANFCKVAKTFPNNKVDSALSGGQEFLPQKLFSFYTYIYSVDVFKYYDGLYVLKFAVWLKHGLKDTAERVKEYCKKSFFIYFLCKNFIVYKT